MGVAIIGMAPYRIIPEDYELWGVSLDPGWSSFDRLFEMHDISTLRPRNLKRLDDIWVPLYMQKDDYPSAVKYPLKQVIALGKDYFQSSIAYMIGLAILEDYKEIGLFGISAEEDYGNQRANMEYWLGIARGRGIKVTVQEGGSLFKYKPEIDFPNRYGYK